VQDDDLPLHLASRYQASLEVISALVQANPAAARMVNKKSGLKPFSLWLNHAENMSPDQRLAVTRLFILPGADMSVIKSELDNIYGKKFDEFDPEKKEVLQPADVVQVALSINISLARLQLAEDEPIARAEFIDTCTRHVLDSAPVLSAGQKHALAGMSSLLSFGEAYRLVQCQRNNGLATGQKIKAFDSLVDILKRHRANQCVAKVAMSAQTIETTEQNAAKQRGDLRMSQRMIKDESAAFVDSADKKTQMIQSIGSLPETVKQKINDRDTMRSKHAQDLKAWLEELLHMPCPCFAQGIETISDVEVKELGAMEAREVRLKVALDAACAGVHAYNTQWYVGVNLEYHLMGARVSMTSASVVPASENEALNTVLTCYDDWVSTYLTDAQAQKTDAAISALTNDTDVAMVLGLKQNATCTGSFEKAFTSAGSAIKQERAQQLADALGLFPCTSILHVGRQLLKIWQQESEGMKHRIRLYRMLEKDLEMHTACLDSKDSGGITGHLCQQRDVVLQELREAREVHTKSMMSLQSLTPVIEGGNETQIQAFAQMFGLLGVPTNELQEKLRRDVRVARDTLTTASQNLTGEMQRHFPEVVLFIGQGLPLELASLWRPAQSLDSFDEKEQVVTAGMDARHNLWRVRSGEVWFAIKEYGIKQSSRLRTCLNEAAIVHRHRHHAIVEIVALFQGDGGSKFYMHMPLYEHGALDKWVCGDQDPKWPKVRSVLLDALVGLSHLHENRILHGDIKPANILVDSRERGRLSDFDISVDTKERTSAGYITGTRTMHATQTAWTEDFAAPELKAEEKATKYTDVFAYGKTVLWVHANGRCEPNEHEEDPHHARGHTAAFVTALTSDQPSIRPCAIDAM